MSHVYDPSQLSGITSVPGQPGSTPTSNGGTPAYTAGSSLRLNDLADVSTAGGTAYQVLYRRTDGTYALKTIGYGRIAGSFPTSGDLIAAYPSGNGDASYVVGDNLWVWDSTEWVDVGTFRGEPGAPGIDGQDGSGIVVKGTATWDEISLEAAQPGDMWILGEAEVGIGSTGDGLVWADTQWVNVGQIRGPQGIQGIQGVQGLKGDTGDQGIQGIQGIQGLKGDKGDQGIQGIQGLKGDTGNTGAQGLKGDKGDKGDTGSQGIQGIQGIQGLKGDTGDTGATGAASTVAGPQGIPGTAGADGKTILYGNTNPSSGLGVNGDFFINTNTNFLFGPKAAGTWPAGTSLVGPQGIQGVQGIQGTTGSQGIQGPAGTNGTDGIDGTTLRYGAGAPANGVGFDGEFYINTTTNFIYGPKATTWPAGVSLVGPQGIQGIQGAQGIQGVKGDTGDIGPQGIQGLKGDTGDSGPQGIQGIKGDTGDQGIQGIQGIQGVAGADGSDGVDGVNPSVLTLGGIATLSQKVYSAKIPLDLGGTIHSATIACTAGTANVNFRLLRNGVLLGTEQTLTASSTYQTFTLGYSVAANSFIQFEVTSNPGGTPPTDVTLSLRCTLNAS